MKRAAADMGGLSVLVHNAGIGGQLTVTEASDLDQWRKVQAVNADSICFDSAASLTSRICLSPS